MRPHRRSVRFRVLSGSNGCRSGVGQRHAPARCRGASPRDVDQWLERQRAHWPRASWGASVGSAAAVAEQPAGVALGLLVVLDGAYAVDEHGAISRGLLDAAPLAAGEVLDDLVRSDAEPFGVVDHDVGWAAGSQQAAVVEPGELGGKGGEPPMGVFVGDPLALADLFGQRLGRVPRPRPAATRRPSRRRGLRPRTALRRTERGRRGPPRRRVAPHPEGLGISAVFVNGVRTIEDDRQTERHPGRLLRHGRG